jgi:flavin reductase (DIM6/NTAB) family NADH-FMN oxidoreductase RutF
MLQFDSIGHAVEAVHPVPTGLPFSERSAAFKAAMRAAPSAVTLVTTRDRRGQPHGMVASSVVPVSMDPPSLLIAVNRTAGIHPVLLHSMRLCVNYLADGQDHLLRPFSRSDLKPQRFASADWRNAIGAVDGRLPWLPRASAAVFGDIDRTVDYGTHTLFIARVTDVALPRADGSAQPLVWLASQCAPLAPRA